MPESWYKAYFRRARNMRQMDFNSAFCQMIYICFSPQKLVKTTEMRKSIKNHWARDDPAFAVMLLLGLVITSLAYAIALTQYHLFREGVYGLLKALFSSIIIHFLAIGIILSSINFLIAENHLKNENSKFAGAGGKIEWLYCFDVHCNAFLPVFFICYVFQYFLLPVLLYEHFLTVVLSAIINCFALSYYFYITSQGFSAIPFLKNTEYFLVPIAGIVLFSVMAIILRVNITYSIIALHF